MNRKSTIMSGRTIGGAREQLETKRERAAARKKDKQKKFLRISITTAGFILLAIVLGIFTIKLVSDSKTEPLSEETDVTIYQPTIEIVEEDATHQITGRMTSYIGQAEADLRDLGYTPSKVVVPSGSIRTIHFYLNGYTGYIKMTIDRETAVSVEDTDRLIRYLTSQGITDFEYLDVRTPGKAFWK